MDRECDGAGGCLETPLPDETCQTTDCPDDTCDTDGDWLNYGDTCTNQCDDDGECEICSCSPVETDCLVGATNACCVSTCSGPGGCATVAGSCSGGGDTCTASTLDVSSTCQGCGANGANGVCAGGGTYSCTEAEHTACQTVSCGGTTYYCTNLGDVWEWRTAPDCSDGNPCTFGDTCGGTTCGGTAIDCDSLDTTCMDAQCDGDATCAFVPRNLGVSCDDSDLCTYATTCTSSGTCGNGGTVTCDDTACFDYFCDGDASCGYTINGGAPCDDGNPATSGDTCQADGSCEGSTCTTASIGFSTDWSSSDYGFTVVSPWARGTPSGTTCHSGSSCFATSLNSSYGTCVDAALTSPAINLSTCGSNTVELRFWHTYNCESSSFLWDGGNLQISADNGASWTVLEPAATPYTGTIYSTSTSCTPLPSIMANAQEVWGGTALTSWQQVVATIPAGYKTSQFRFRFVFASDSSIYSYLGWVVDDVEIVAY